MPNGGMLPCCRLCQYAERSQRGNDIHCRRHHFHVPDAFHTFCPDLSKPDGSAFDVVLQHPDVVPGQVYVWTTVVYRTMAHPTLPQYQHNIRPLAPIPVYRAWSDAERQAAATDQQQHDADAFAREYSIEAHTPSWGERIRTLLNHLFGSR
ncbi:MAG: hypothetical protein M3R24_30225 [Chloroflexota bacterium]|nr:hypothetical protein [Chloroflexota bacterium]